VKVLPGRSAQVCTMRRNTRRAEINGGHALLPIIDSQTTNCSKTRTNLESIFTVMEAYIYLVITC